MSGRLDQEREARLQPLRITKAITAIKRKGYHIHDTTSSCVKFYYKNNLISYFPYSGWHSGKGIKDGRGLENLLKQI